MAKSLPACCLVVLFCCSLACAEEYESAIAGWDSYHDVATWLNDHFRFDKSRQQEIRSRLRAHGPEGLLVRDPRKTYLDAKGYCADAAGFALDALNAIDPAYNAQWVFIRNSGAGPNHWVTGFYVDDRIFIMDYGAGRKWSAMTGLHGPYDSLSEYRRFLSSLDMQGFEVDEVVWRDMPGTVD